ncbi:alkaline phosphatase family protein [Ammoniphilus sp. 3BR4]|uniref:alkaline phosphatase family protein n=1 Tax=Ammoniphilus sp. 3BR4 TaxID=3158265 RepID=UPI003466CD54
MIDVRFAILIILVLVITYWVYVRIGRRKKPVFTAEEGKKVVLIIVDSLLSEPLESLMAQNQAPAFSFLRENGSYTNRMVSSFPTMSVTIDSTLLTGSYADEHRVPGLRWFKMDEKRLIHYGDGVIPTIKSGIRQVMKDGLFHLNNTHLSEKKRTIHEELAASNRSTASINGLVYRSNHPKDLGIPWPFAAIQTMAPDYFVLGNFYRYLVCGFYSFIRYYGVNNQVSIRHLVDLIRGNQLSSFTMVYLADLDHESHKQGEVSSKSVLQVDRQLQDVLNAFGKWEKALEKHIFIVMGDSGLSKIKNDKEEAIVDLDRTFSTMKVAPLGHSRPHDEIALAVNERMSYIYALQAHVKLQDIVNRLKQDERLDTISWRDQDWVYVLQGGSEKEMRFRKGRTLADEYDQQWDIEGEMEVLDLRRDPSGAKVTYGSYPDGLMRLYGAHYSHEGRFLIVTTCPGYEMKGTSSPTHVGGGSHGAFHEVDSFFPMFIAGTKESPKYNRLVDLKEFILGLLNPT